MGNDSWDVVGSISIMSWSSIGSMVGIWVGQMVVLDYGMGGIWVGSMVGIWISGMGCVWVDSVVDMVGLYYGVSQMVGIWGNI